jgi:hypothetical protein
MNDNPKGTGTEVFSAEYVLAKGVGTVFRGSPDLGVIAGPEYSPQLPGALSHAGVRNDGPSGAGPIRAGGGMGSDVSGDSPGLDSGSGTPPEE